MTRCGKPIDGLECNRSAGHGGPCDPAVIFWYDYLKQVGAAYVPKKRKEKMANAVLDKLQEAAKAVVGGLAGALISVLSTTVTDPNAVINPDAPDGANAIVQLPNTTAEWVTFVVSVVLGFALPWLKRNFPSVPAAEKQLAVAKVRVARGKQSK
jgi:hypothetical protein